MPERPRKDEYIRNSGFRVEFKAGPPPDDGSEDEQSRIDQIKAAEEPAPLSRVFSIIVLVVLIIVAIIIAMYSFGSGVSLVTFPGLDAESGDPSIERIDIATEWLESAPVPPGAACDPSACGDAVCNASCEDIAICPADCGTPAPYDPCGNGVCDPGEHVYNCTADCGEPPADSGGSCACNFKCYVYDAKDKSICLQGGGVDCNGNACTP